MSEHEQRQIGLQGGGSVSGLWTPPRSHPTGWSFVYAPGAGANLHDPFGAYAARALAAAGIGTLRIQFPYMQAGRRSPDREPVLEATWLGAIGAATQEGMHLVVGGRSMGGRIAAQVVSQGAAVVGLALFAYPLHPPGRPERSRDEFLPRISVPTLFGSGTNDAFGSPDELRSAAARVPHGTLHLLADADHGFSVPRSSGRTRQGVWAEAVQALIEWVRHQAG